MRHILILGGTSAIATEAARLYAADGDKLFLVDRNEDLLQSTADDLKVRGARQAAIHPADLTDRSVHAQLFSSAEEAMGGLDTIILAYGTLSDQERCENDPERTEKELDINFVSAAALLTRAANYLEDKGSGSIAAISSVAGDRGRRSNYVYGSAKAGLTAFLSGLRARLSRKGISVSTIKPGLVDSPMTAHLDKQGLLWTKPETVGKAIYTAVNKGKATVYVPWFWSIIMFVIRSLPEFIFKKLNI